MHQEVKRPEIYQDGLVYIWRTNAKSENINSSDDDRIIYQAPGQANVFLIAPAKIGKPFSPSGHASAETLEAEGYMGVYSPNYPKQFSPT